MFCIVCGKQLHSEYKYLACQQCFDEKREKLLKQSAFNADGTYGFTGLGPQIGVSGVFGYPAYPTPEEELPPAYFVYSERAENPYHEKPGKKHGRLLRVIEEDGYEGDNLL